MHSTSGAAFWVQALTGDIVLCSRARHLKTVPLSTLVYKWVLAINDGSDPAMD